MLPYYIETEWNVKKGLDVVWVYKRGEPRHFAVFYDRISAQDYVNYLNAQARV